MADTFTKLFGSIVRSSIWQENDQTVKVWITLLALSDQDGNVMTSIPGLAHTARVSIEATEAAISRFLEPDKYSRTPDFEGRRIEMVRGGIHLLNHGAYRRLMSHEDRKEYNRQKQQESRMRQRMSNNVSTCQQKSAMSAHTEAETDLDSEAEANGSQAGRHGATNVRPLNKDSFAENSQTTADSSADSFELRTKPEPATKKIESTAVEKKPRKPRKDKVQTSSYNPVGLWIERMARTLRVNSIAVIGQEPRLLTQVGNAYSEAEFVAMMKAYGESLVSTGRACSVSDFCRNHATWRGKARVETKQPESGSEEELNRLYGNK